MFHIPKPNRIFVVLKSNKDKMSSNYICQCNRVSEKVIYGIIKKKEVQTMRELILRSGAGGGCGRCLPSVKKILDNSLQSMQVLQLKIGW
jgi:bacterioferritin-associated ferredoxin